MVLRALSDRLDLPQPARSRILVEVSGDLEALFESYRGRGLSAEEAEREALARIDLSSEALEALVRVHGGWFRRFVDALAHRAGALWERVLLVLLIVGSVALSGGLLQAVPMSRAAGPWLVPVGCAAVGALIVAVWKAWELLLLGDHRPSRLRRGLDALLGLSVLQMFLAFTGLWLTAIGATGSIAGDPMQAGTLTMRWLERSLALLIPGLGVALLSGLVWFFLLMKVVSIEHQEATALLADSAPRV
jgi:hypothetical protein